MGELRRASTGGFEDQDMLKGVGEVVLAADDVADANVDVVGAGGEMVGGHAIAAEEGEIFDVGGGFGLRAVDSVGEMNLVAGFARHTEAEGKRIASGGATIAFGAGKIGHAGIEEPSALGAGFFAVAGVGGGEVAVGETFFKDRPGDFAMEVEALGLLVFLVPTEVEPAQAVEYGGDGGVGVALDVGIVETEDHGAIVMAGIEPVKDKGAGATDVEKSGGGGRKANARLGGSEPRVFG
jgi:hypothetical protein